jgi:hypothetical protein
VFKLLFVLVLYILLLILHGTLIHRLFHISLGLSMPSPGLPTSNGASNATSNLGNIYTTLSPAKFDPPDNDDGLETLATWELAKRNTMCILILSIVELKCQLIRNCDTACDIWRTLELNFRDISMLRQCNTFEQLISLKYQLEKTIHNHIAAFNKLYQEIKTFDHFKELPDAI